MIKTLQDLEIADFALHVTVLGKDSVVHLDFSDFKLKGLFFKYQGTVIPESWIKKAKGIFWFAALIFKDHSKFKMF